MESNIAYAIHVPGESPEDAYVGSNVSYNTPDHGSALYTQENSQYSNLENQYATPDEVVHVFKHLSQGRNNYVILCRAVISALVFSLFSLLVAILGVVYTNVDLKQELNAKSQSLNGQLNSSNEHMQILLDSILAVQSNISKQGDEISRDLSRIQSVIGNLSSSAFSPGTLANPAASCTDIPRDRPSGNYWIQTNNVDSPFQAFCDMDQTYCSCNAGKEWMRVANINMSDPNQTCPNAFRLKTSETPPLRTCGRSVFGCTNVVFPTFGVEFSHVCGKVIAYQEGSPGGFFSYNSDNSITIDDRYVEGISLTHGRSPRQHIWTFAAALDELTSFGPNRSCPCINSEIETGVAPPFINEDYFCDTGSRDRFQHILYRDDPLWDGQGCGGSSTCCQFNNPPYFCKQLPHSTTDDIELRLCFETGDTDVDILIEVIQISIQ